MWLSQRVKAFFAFRMLVAVFVAVVACFRFSWPSLSRNFRHCVGWETIVSRQDDVVAQCLRQGERSDAAVSDGVIVMQRN